MSAHPGPDASTTVDAGGPFDVRRSLAGLSIARDPTRRSFPGEVRYAGRTPDGPVAVRVTADHETVTVDGWGPGAGWVTGGQRVAAIVARHDDPRRLHFGHDRLDEVNRRHPGIRHAATGLVVDHLLGRILGQRVLSTEAGRSWAALCHELGGPAPGPLALQLPPDPTLVAEKPTWWFHERGVERSRARTLVAVASRAERLTEVVDLPLPDAYRRLRAVDGLGPWTVNGVARVALGDPDAIVLGDYWIGHEVCSFFTGRPRGSDEEMLALVEPWTGQRGRVERLVHLSGHRVQRFAAGRRTPDIRRL